MKKIVTIALFMLSFCAYAQDSSKFNIGILSQMLKNYDNVSYFISQDLAIVRENSKFGVVDYNGNLITPLYKNILPMEGNIFYIFGDDGGGIMDNKGNILLPMKYTAIKVMSDGMIGVQEDDRYWGYVNDKCELIIPCKYEYASDFSEGYARVGNEPDYFYINKMGEKVGAKKPQLTQAGYTYYKDYEDRDERYKVTLIDSLGNAKVEYFDYVYDCSDKTLVVENNKKKGLVTAKGVFIPCNYDDIKQSEDGISYSVFRHGDLAVVKKQGKWGVIDRKGKQIIQCLYDYIDTDYNVICAKKSGKYRVFDCFGKPISPISYDLAEPLGENVIAVKKLGKCSLIDKKAKTLFDNYKDKYKENDYIVIKKNNMYYAIDRNGQKMFNSNNPLYPINQYYAKIADSDEKGFSERRYGVINNEGKVIVPCEYDERISFYYGLFEIYKEGKQGFADTNGGTTFNVLKD